MMTEKDRLIKQLKQLIFNDSAWLNVEDQHAIERKIDELDIYINQRYATHGKDSR